LDTQAGAGWWRTFFTGTFVDFWLAVPTAEQNEKEADFLQEALQVSPPARLLDVPCGGGRHSLSLAARGYKMTGVDISPEFLESARANTGSTGRPGDVSWEQREMREPPWSETFDGAFCFGNSFGYDEEEGNAAFLKAVARALKPGTRFVLDTGYVLENLLPNLQERGWYEFGEILVLSERRYDPVTSRLHVEYVLIREGKLERRNMSARLYSYRELVQLLEMAGFREIQGYSSMAWEPFKLGSNRLLMIATKPGTS
jgi:SAM-dependent methyltransferase